MLSVGIDVPTRLAVWVRGRTRALLSVSLSHELSHNPFKNLHIGAFHLVRMHLREEIFIFLRITCKKKKGGGGIRGSR